MSLSFTNLSNFLNNGKNFYKIFFFLVVFLCITKLPALLTSDIQPWDEGMYAARVLSIHVNGDFIDQKIHSVGGYYSASHPPLLIWIGYIVTFIFGMNAAVFKLIIFIFSILCVLLILLIGRILFTAEIGFYAALIFCSNIIFEVFSQRFQFDIPYTFFILLSFYFVFLYNDTPKFKYLVLSGISFGCCLMIKILVGFYIPMVLFISCFLIRDRINFKFRDLLILTVTGILFSLPWHLYMFINAGSEFTDYFFKFHIIDRALHGVEMNEKGSGVLYHANYLLSIVPYGILAFLGLFSDMRNFRKREWQRQFIDIWFVTGLIILALFKTKLEVYVLMILLPASFLIPLFLRKADGEALYKRVLIVMLLLLNVLWFATETYRPELKLLFLQSSKLLSLTSVLLLLVMLFYVSKTLANKIELKNTIYIFILIFFLSINVYYLINTPEWNNKYKLSAIKDYIDGSEKRKILYIGTEYRYNPQFSFYFKGLNLNWEKKEFEFELIDTKDKIEGLKEYLGSLQMSNYYFIVEKDYINRADYPSSELFIPAGSKLIRKEPGYELYEY